MEDNGYSIMNFIINWSSFQGEEIDVRILTNALWTVIGKLNYIKDLTLPGRMVGVDIFYRENQ